MSPPKGHQSPSAPGRGAAESGASCGFLSPGGPRNMAGGGGHRDDPSAHGQGMLPLGGRVLSAPPRGSQGNEKPGIQPPPRSEQDCGGGGLGPRILGCGRGGPEPASSRPGWGLLPPPPRVSLGVAAGTAQLLPSLGRHPVRRALGNETARGDQSDAVLLLPPLSKSCG